MFVMSRFSKSFLAVIAILSLFSMIAFLHLPTRAYIDPWTGQLFGEGGVEKFWHNNSLNAVYDYTGGPSHKTKNKPGEVTSSTVHGGVIMSKLGNATAKQVHLIVIVASLTFRRAALGRATWKLLHTMTLRFPEHPLPDERTALSSYFHLLSRLYPCGECAAEFQALLKQYPPQTSSRRAAALWLCSVHNEVNKRLGKEQFDCANLDAEYDCGCGGEPVKQEGKDTELEEPGDPMDLEHDHSVDKDTGISMIKGG